MLLNQLFDKYDILTTRESMPGSVTDGKGRYMDASVLVRMLINAIERDTDTYFVVADALDLDAPSDDESDQTHDFTTTEGVSSPPSNTITEGVESQDKQADEPEIDLPSYDPDPADFIPPVNLRPYLLTALDTVREQIPGAEEVEPLATPLVTTYAAIPAEHKLFFRANVRMANAGARKTTGIQPDSTTAGQSFLVWGVLFVGDYSPTKRDLPSEANGPMLRGIASTLEDGSDVWLHVLQQVETVTVLRDLPIFRSLRDTLSSQMKNRANARQTTDGTGMLRELAANATKDEAKPTLPPDEMMAAFQEFLATKGY